MIGPAALALAAVLLAGLLAVVAVATGRRAERRLRAGCLAAGWTPLVARRAMVVVPEPR